MTEQGQIDRIERDRKRREREFTALLLALCIDAERHAVYAARIGSNILNAARNVWMGSAALNQPGAVPVIAEAMADADVAGFRRAHLLAGLPPWKRAHDIPEMRALEAHYTPQAQQLAERVWSVIELKLDPATRAAVDLKARLKAIRQAFDEAQVTDEHPSTLETNATQSILQKYQMGYGRGMQSPKIAAQLTGFKFAAIIDDRTTDICREYHGTALPVDHWWWRGHAPPCHFNCRSTYLPIFTDFEETSVPALQPMPGFGFNATGPLTPYAAHDPLNPST